MCEAFKTLGALPMKLHSKMENKISENDPITTRIEQSAGWRPWTSTQMATKHLGIDTGRKKNQYYRPGAAGNPHG